MGLLESATIPRRVALRRHRVHHLDRAQHRVSQFRHLLDPHGRSRVSQFRHLLAVRLPDAPAPAPERAPADIAVDHLVAVAEHVLVAQALVAQAPVAQAPEAEDVQAAEVALAAEVAPAEAQVAARQSARVVVVATAKNSNQ